MDRIQLKCPVAGQETDLQFDKKAMPGEAGPCFMITVEGCFKGYIARQKDGLFQPIGAAYYTTQDLQVIIAHLSSRLNFNESSKPSQNKTSKTRRLDGQGTAGQQPLRYSS